MKKLILLVAFNTFDVLVITEIQAYRNSNKGDRKEKQCRTAAFARTEKCGKNVVSLFLHNRLEYAVNCKSAYKNPMGIVKNCNEFLTE